jgi:uncharacterized protein (DUF2235 family)
MRRLVVCSDGTWKSAESKEPTNVVIFAQALPGVAPDGIEQRHFYDPGVGTGSFIDRVSGGAFGSGLSENVKDAYGWLVTNYEPGDEIFLVGFSRGAYTVRSAAGLIRKCGLLRREHADRIRAAYDLYRQRDRSPDSDEARAFRERFSRAVEIAFLGVWDTVGSLGVPLVGLRLLTRLPYRFHDTELTGIVKRAYHAVAIDERRRAFDPALWTNAPKPGQQIEQVWFAGVHSNIGGGYPDRGLSDIALLWMIDRARAAGLSFKDEYLEARVKPNEAGTLYNSLTGAYLALGWHTRVMGVRGAAESVHVSALARHGHETPGYTPKPLTRYLERVPVSVSVDPLALADTWLRKLPARLLALVHRGEGPIDA